MKTFILFFERMNLCLRPFTIRTLSVKIFIVCHNLQRGREKERGREEEDRRRRGGGEGEERGRRDGKERGGGGGERWEERGV